MSRENHRLASFCEYDQDIFDLEDDDDDESIEIIKEDERKEKEILAWMEI